MTVHTKMHF